MVLQITGGACKKAGYSKGEVGEVLSYYEKV